MYNTVFKVKYNDIEKELIDKLNFKNPETNSDEEYEYSNQDVLDICNKLYRDELLSVFCAEDLSDDKLDKGMSYVYEIMMINERFNDIINEMETTLINGFIKNKNLKTKKNLRNNKEKMKKTRKQEIKKTRKQENKKTRNK